MDIAVRPHVLPTVLADAPTGLSYLSLDCFDTLIWRNVNAPADVFADLPLPGGGIELRKWAETKARGVVPFRHGRLDVTIDEIYAELMPTATSAEREAAIAAELEAEARHCYAFAPTRDLIVDAKRRGLKVIIVSDTYLSEPRLRALIERAAGPELAALIDRIFCSCEYGMGKADGLFAPVIEALGASPDTILHVGDNKIADQVAPSALGVHTVHLKQFDADAEQRLRLEAVAATMLEPATRTALPALQPHRPQVALRTSDDPALVLGHDVLGPLMHAFAGWIHDEAAAMEASLGKPVRILFLLRDGHLPHQAFVERFPELVGKTAAVEISRFTAAAASFTDAAAIARYLEPELPTGQPAVLARQMLFSGEETQKLIRGGGAQLARRVREEGQVRKITSRSARFTKRLCAYLVKMGVQPGDAVMFVDLGYNGSVQNFVEPVLAAEMGLTIAGRYLLLRETIRSGFDKRGFLDVRHYDNKALHALSESIAIVEQLATRAQGSVVDYREDGTPVRKAPDIKDAQSQCRDAVQQACLAFVRAAASGVVQPPISDDAEARRRMAAAVLARFLFLPLASEVAVLEAFDHDVNLGTRETVRMFAPDAATQGLRRRGLFYTKNAPRMYLPGELQRHGLPVNLSLFGARRFGLDLRKSDFDVGAIPLPVMLADGQAVGEVNIEAHPTADGFYQALIPIGAGRYNAGIQLCRLFDWVQVEEARFLFVDSFMKAGAKEESIPASPIFDSMEEVAPGLYRSLEANGLVFVQPPAGRFDQSLLLSFVFRPIVARAAQLMQKAA